MVRSDCLSRFISLSIMYIIKRRLLQSH